MDISDFSEVGDRDEKLRLLVRELLESAAVELQNTQLPEKQVWQLRSDEDGKATFKAVERPDLNQAISTIDWFSDVEAAVAFQSHLEDEYDREIRHGYLKRLLLDAFQKTGERIDSYDSELERVYSNIVADLHDQSKGECIAILYGLRVIGDAIQISDRVEAQSFRAGEVIAEEDAEKPAALINAHEEFHYSYLRIEYTQDDVLARIPTMGINLYTVALDLSLGGWIRVPHFYLNPISYDIHELAHRFRNEVNSFEAELTEANSKKVENTLSLLRPYHEPTTCEFSSPWSIPYNFKLPVNVAICHYGRSVRAYGLRQSSLTSAIMGLESLFVQQTSGTTPSNDVPQYAGFLIGNTVDGLDPFSVAQKIEEGYEHRNQWAHGGHVDHETSPLQLDLWKILRLSIIIFAWMDTNTSLLDEGLLLENALVDDKTRNAFYQELDPLDISDYCVFE